MLIYRTAVVLADIQIIRALASQIWREHYPTIISREQIEYMLTQRFTYKRVKEQLQQGVIYEIINDSNRDIGYLSYEKDDENNAVNLHQIYILVSEHGKGYGQATLNRVMDYGRKQNLQMAELYVNKNNTKAIQAYTKAGFVIVEELVMDIGNGFIRDDYKMQRSLMDK
ncbi:MAG: GNAT family N-acetyltransferase [Nostocaceae cyanobacterium]|nr:GNAT family N-acetyltransferase [Nostocaceae cyanobacterium]